MPPKGWTKKNSKYFHLIKQKMLDDLSTAGMTYDAAYLTASLAAKAEYKESLYEADPKMSENEVVTLSEGTANINITTKALAVEAAVAVYVESLRKHQRVKKLAENASKELKELEDQFSTWKKMLTESINQRDKAQQIMINAIGLEEGELGTVEAPGGVSPLDLLDEEHNQKQDAAASIKEIAQQLEANASKVKKEGEAMKSYLKKPGFKPKSGMTVNAEQEYEETKF